MSFSTAVAGPSRLPYLARPVAAAAATSSLATRASARGYATPAVQDAGEGSEGAATGFIPADFEKRFEIPALREWLKQVGAAYRTVGPKEKAKWLGGKVPYASNPSFQPPPPLSNDLMDILADDLKKGDKTVGQIAEKHNISKARLEAVRKLKMVEAEFKRQGLPLQQAYQDRMEILLSVKSPLNKHTKTVSLEDRRSEEQSRNAHPSTKLEQDEEWIKEHSTSHAGAFGNLHKQAKYEGMVMEAWQFKSEAETVADRKAAAAAAEPKPIPKWTPPPQPFKLVKPAGTVYRFIDVTKEDNKAKKAKKEAAARRKAKKLTGRK